MFCTDSAPKMLSNWGKTLFLFAKIEAKISALAFLFKKFASNSLHSF